MEISFLDRSGRRRRASIYVRRTIGSGGPTPRYGGGLSVATGAAGPAKLETTDLGRRTQRDATAIATHPVTAIIVISGMKDAQTSIARSTTITTHAGLPPSDLCRSTVRGYRRTHTRARSTMNEVPHVPVQVGPSAYHPAMSIWDELGPIDDLIAEGARLRAEQRADEALAVYVRAWEVAEDLDDDVLRVAASHMIGVVEPDPAKKLEWNLVSLRFADALDERTAADCYPTIYANLGWSYLHLGDREQAREHYEIAERFAVGLDGDYGTSIRAGIDGMLKVLTG
jgi:hypothetical protein